MSILTREDRKDLVYSCRKALLDHVDSSGILTESTRAAARHFILNEASYQDLLNLVYNPNRDTEYLDTEVLESVALNQYADVLCESVIPEQSAFRMVEEAVASNVSTAAKAARKAISKADVIKKAAAVKKAVGKTAVNKMRAGKYGDRLTKAIRDLDLPDSFNVSTAAKAARKAISKADVIKKAAAVKKAVGKTAVNKMRAGKYGDRLTKAIAANKIRRISQNINPYV